MQMQSYESISRELSIEMLHRVRNDREPTVEPLEVWF